jgi:hypothetical protein
MEERMLWLLAAVILVLAIVGGISISPLLFLLAIIAVIVVLSGMGGGARRV